ncbi:hypothetical protein M0G43_07790 [Subsaxibacter sp. CAU 1640]|uniref:hypothetical protein n=1 Tax=Subsaxibacter sp. CAU 1640 TaxID=2933271 RepID=UPI002003F135|nr:hypothetical protein [Subsaxibacter sp. CAU 1640]MCK7590468.1 hypothetical protein [Subsaxibacter sp. CAU 1640]
MVDNPYPTNGAVLNGSVPHNGQNAVVKQAPVAPATVEPNVNVQSQKVAAAKQEADVPKAKKKGRTEETGHGINLRNFGRISNAVDAQGDDYINTNPLLDPDALHDVYDAATQSISTLSNKQALLDVAVEAQVSEYADLKTTCTQAVRFFTTCGVSAMAIAQLKNLNAVIQGYRVIKAKADDLDLNSVSHQSYAQLAIYFEAFIQFLEQQTAYTPGAIKLKPNALRDKHTRMVDKYRAVEMMRTETRNARIARDVIMYKDITGLVDRAYAVKNVFLSLFGSRSFQYKEISGLSFRKCPNHKYL